MVDDLRKLRKDWGEERTYQEARKIVSAIIQHITYSEFLPRILGPTTMARFSLSPTIDGHSDVYDSECSSGIFNMFSTAAFRFGH